MIQLTHKIFQKPFMSIVQDARRCLATAAPRPSTPVPETAAVEQFRTGEMDDEEEGQCDRDLGRAQGGSHSAHTMLEADPCIPYQECMRILMLTIMTYPRACMLLPTECTQTGP